MAFMDRLGTAFKGAIKETLSDTDAVSDTLSTILKGSLGSAFVDSPAEQIGMQQELIAQDDNRRAALAKAQEEYNKRQTFVQEEMFKNRLKTKREREKREYDTKTKQLEFAKNVFLETAKAAGENGLDKNSEAVKALVQSGKLFGMPEESIMSFIMAHTPKPELSPTMQLYDDFTKLRKKGIIKDNNFFGYYRRMKINDSMVQRYTMYVDTFKATKEQKKPISFLEFLKLNDSTSKAKGAAGFTEAEKARRKFLIDFVQKVREGKASLYDTAQYDDDAVGGRKIIGAGLPYLAAIEELNSKFNFNMRTPKPAEVAGWIELMDRKKNADSVSQTPADKNARVASTLYPGKLAQNAQNNVSVNVPQELVSKNNKPQNYVPKLNGIPNKDYIGSEAIKYVDSARKSLIALAEVKTYNKTLSADFGLDEDEFNEFQGLYRNAQATLQARRSSKIVFDNNAGGGSDQERLAKLTAKILRHTGDYEPLGNILYKEMMPKMITEQQTAQMGVAPKMRIHFNTQIADNFPILAMATGVTTPNVTVDPAQNLIDQKEGVRIEQGNNHVTIFGPAKNMSDPLQEHLLALSTKIQKDPEAQKLFKQVYDYRNKVKDETYLDLKYDLINRIALKTPYSAKDEIFTESIFDIFLSTAQRFETGDKFLGVVATPPRSAVYVPEGYISEDGRQVPKTPEGLAQEVKKAQASIQNIGQALNKVDDIATLISKLVNGSGDPSVSQQNSLEGLGNIDVQKLRDLQKQPVTGIASTIRDFATSSKILVPSIANVIRDSFIGIAGDRINKGGSFHDEIAKGFEIKVEESDLAFVADNQTFMTQGLSNAIESETKAINAEYNALMNNKDSLTQNDIDLHFLRRRILWEKISLTYTLAGYVQGDQAGGRTISNEDFAQVRKALWGTPITEQTPNLVNMIKHLRLTLGNSYSQQLGRLSRLEMFGPGVGSLPSTELTQRFRREKLLKDVQLTNIEKRVNSKLEQKINSLKAEDYPKFVMNTKAIVMPFKKVQSIRNDEPYDGFQKDRQDKRFTVVLDELNYLYDNSKVGNIKIPGSVMPGTNQPFPEKVTPEDLREIFVSQKLVTNFLRNGQDILKTTDGVVPPVYLEAYKRLDLDNFNEYSSLRLLYAITDLQIPANYYALSRDPLSFLNVAYKISDTIKTDVTKFKYLNMLKEIIEQGDIDEID